MLILHYLVGYALLYLQGAAALPQEITSSEVSNVTSATPAGTSIVDDGRHCDFTKMEDFFHHAHKNNLNITLEVQKCQNLCLLTYGVGNPDLSGIGVSSQYIFSVFSINIVANRLCLLL
jgi:hypothetical protein